MKTEQNDTRIGMVGQGCVGYIGLPLAVEFGKRYDTVLARRGSHD